MNKNGFEFSRWLDGETDPYLDKIEIRPKKEKKRPSYDDAEERKRLKEKLYDPSQNKELKIFFHLYRIMCVIFCLVLIGVLWATVSYLPPTGDADRPDNN